MAAANLSYFGSFIIAVSTDGKNYTDTLSKRYRIYIPVGKVCSFYFYLWLDEIYVTIFIIYLNNAFNGFAIYVYGDVTMRGTDYVECQIKL